MPRRDPMEAQWPPAQARLLCYSCGVKFQEESAKQRCRLCFDIFCKNCCAGEAHMPSSYGYNTPQLVCRTCQHLIALFPTFLGPLDASPTTQGNRAALLPPNYCVVILTSTIAKDTSHDAGGAPRPLGALEKFAQWITKGSRTFKCTDVRSLTLGAFRPINPDTKICVGREIFISLSEIADVSAENGVLTILLNSGNLSTTSGDNNNNQNSNNANGSKATKNNNNNNNSNNKNQNSADNNNFSSSGTDLLAAGKKLDPDAEYVRLLVGAVPGLASASMLGKDASCAEGDVNDGNNMVFTVDPEQAVAVCDSLKELRKHLKRHFAFSASASCISQSSISHNNNNPPKSPNVGPQR